MSKRQREANRKKTTKLWGKAMRLHRESRAHAGLGHVLRVTKKYTGRRYY